MAHTKPRKKQTPFHATVHQLLNLVIPRAHNGYHPHIISRWGLTAIVCIGMIGLATSGGQEPAVLGDQPKVTPAMLLQEVNAERATEGVAPLELNQQLADAALAKGNDMFAEQYWAHNSPRGVTPWKWIQDEGYAYNYAGENLAKNFDSAQSTVDAWMASPAHRENMLHGYYDDAGFAIVNGTFEGKPATIIVAMFASPQSANTAVASATFGADVGTQFGALSLIGLSLQAMNPAVLASVILSMFALFVAGMTFVTTHLRIFERSGALNTQTMYSSYSWLQHHTVSKAIVLMTFVAALIIVFSGGGQL
ncbi:CAP domain-containing protein [Candidatus Saccharibacteria bacterium]|nr:CAP domain-containing protein [Candidatus Saccharibacteria bacterium]